MPSVIALNHKFPGQYELADYVFLQLRSCTPDASDIDRSLLLKHMENTLGRMQPILAKVVMFKENHFDHLHSLQYATFLYLLANEIWLHQGNNNTSERLFLLNRSMNSLDVYYKIALPEVFLIAHGLGSVLANANYGQNFVFFQNTTVGRIGDLVPRIGNNVILFSGSAVLGSSVIGHGSVITAGTIVNNTEIPENSLVFSDSSGLIVKQRNKNYLSHYIRE